MSAIHTKGTWNPSNAGTEDPPDKDERHALRKQSWSKCGGRGRWRYIRQKITIDQLPGGSKDSPVDMEQQNDRRSRAFDDRYIIVYVRDNGLTPSARGGHEAKFSIGFVFFDIAIRHFFVGSFNSPLSQSYMVTA